MLFAVMAFLVSAQNVTPLDTFLSELKAQRAEVRAFSARFTQETESQGLSVKAQGKVLYLAPRRLLIQYDSQKVSYLIDANRVYEYDGRMEQVQSYAIDADPDLEALCAGFESDPARLTKAFKVALAGTEKNRALELRPKDGNSDSLFEKIEVSFSESKRLPSQIRVELGEVDGTTTLTLSGYEVNAGVGDKDVSLLLPEGTTIVQDGKAIGTAGKGGRRIPEIVEPGPPIDELPVLPETELAPPVGSAK